MFSIKSLVFSAVLAVYFVSSTSATAIERRQGVVCPGVCPPLLFGGSIILDIEAPVYMLDVLATDPTSRPLVCRYALNKLVAAGAGFTGPDATTCTYDGATGDITADGNPTGLCEPTTDGAAACTVGL